MTIIVMYFLLRQREKQMLHQKSLRASSHATFHLIIFNVYLSNTNADIPGFIMETTISSITKDYTTLKQ